MIDVQTDIPTYSRRMDRWTGGNTKRCTDGLTEKQTDVWTNAAVEIWTY